MVKVSYPEGNFGINQLLGSSINISFLRTAQTSDLHVSKVSVLQLDFSSIQPGHSKFTILSGCKRIAFVADVCCKHHGTLVDFLLFKKKWTNLICFRFALFCNEKRLAMHSHSSVRVSRRAGLVVYDVRYITVRSEQGQVDRTRNPKQCRALNWIHATQLPPVERAHINMFVSSLASPVDDPSARRQRPHRQVFSQARNEERLSTCT